MTNDRACRLAGIHRSTFYHWLRLDKESKSGKYSDFLDTLKKAESGWVRWKSLRRLICPMVPCDFSSCLLFLPPGDRVQGRDGRGNDRRGTPYAEPDAGGAAPADVTPARGKVMRRGAIRSNQPRLGTRMSGWS